MTGEMKDWQAQGAVRVMVLLTMVISMFGFGAVLGLAQEEIACGPAASDATPEATPAVLPVEPAPFPEEGGELTIFAAASLISSFEQIAADIEAANPGVTISYNFAGSQSLVTQLDAGADADILATANISQMENAVDAGVIDGEPVVFTQNRLAIVVPADNPAGIGSLADLANDGVTLVLAAPEVPVGQYAREVACKAADDPETYGDDFIDGFEANIVSNEENVTAVLTKVRLGEAEAGIVYSTDVTPDVADDVLLIEIPDPVNVIAEYPIAPVVGGDALLAEAFIAYLLGSEGQVVLGEAGFDVQP